MPPLKSTELLAAARAFCDSFAQKKPLDEVLSHFSSPSPSATPTTGGDAGIIIHEHGLPQLAPFLGRDFYGLEGARKYFEVVGRYLNYEKMQFVEFIADASPGSEGDRGNGEDEDGGKVVVRGKARFTWTETSQSWDEAFVYLLRFDARAKLRRYEVWADSGAVYLAGRGELGSAGKRKGAEPIGTDPEMTFTY